METPVAVGNTDVRRIALTGGGTAGHITPLLALVPHLKEAFSKIIFIGSHADMDKDMVAGNLPFFGLDSPKFVRSNLLSAFKIPKKLAAAVKAAKDILVNEGISVVFSKGGFAALPTCLAARKLKIPVVTHESDFSLGLSNRIISKFAAKTLSSFDSIKGATEVGSPVRNSVLNGSGEKAKIFLFNTFGTTPCPKLPVVLIFGGSLGAKAINEAVSEALPKLTESFTVIHIIGKDNEASPSKNYFPLKFADNMGDLFALSSVVVCRGGSNSLFEAASLNKRCVCIPLPKGASRGDQIQNAEYFAKKGWVSVLRQEDLTADRLFTEIAKKFNEPKPDCGVKNACENICGILKSF
ncbi:MAG: UDP-N-acetylglucosamine--N-acetylmuramyl-(pentapeptide) pyrophosphoryl-undecaprenol N-acetylglucosamine transferase [Christensenellaceae bacterium]|jgi:UDP-N-acetylglucosamine--N-acetylmuramyl-(pentapeptide) pyrophosphoryl-undecaprenol N-acetylglucosamine transferase|nr:UDP-N-acetylglucosamine--N-acetylmuramyl-(pentapeptide) pyrophosphoryl-undecaprenol N-acetylglucosamine transferase [Christensenellaceae bacterium]